MSDVSNGVFKNVGVHVKLFDDEDFIYSKLKLTFPNTNTQLSLALILPIQPNFTEITTNKDIIRNNIMYLCNIMKSMPDDLLVMVNTFIINIRYRT